MSVVVVLHIVSDGLRRGELIGWVDIVATGRRHPVRSAWELVEVLRRAEDEAQRDETAPD